MTDLATLEVRINSKGVDRAKDSLGRYVAEGRKAERATGELDQSTRRLDRSAGGLSKSLGGLSALLGGVGLVASLRASVGVLTRFEDGLVGISKTTGLAGAGLERIETAIERLATNSAAPIADLLGIAQAAGQLGIRGSANIVQFTDAVSRLADAAPSLRGSVDTVSLSLAKLLSVTGESTGNVTALASTIALLGDTFPTTEANIIQTGLEIAKAGAAFGVTSEEAVGLATAFASIGTESELARSALVQVFGAINKAVATGSDELDTFAKIAGQSSDAFAELFDRNALSATVDFVEGLGEAQAAGQRTTVILDELGLSSVRLQPTLLTLAKNSDQLGAALAAAGEEFANPQKLAAEFAAGSDRLGAAFGRLRNSTAILIEGFADDSTGLAGGLRSVTEYATDIIRVLAGLEGEVRGSSEAAKVGAAAFFGLATAAGAYAVGAGAASVATRVLSASLLASPLGPVALALGAAAAAALYFKDQVVDLDGETKTYGEAATDTWQDLKASIDDAVTSLDNWLTRAREAQGVDPQLDALLRGDAPAGGSTIGGISSDLVTSGVVDALTEQVDRNAAAWGSLASLAGEALRALQTGDTSELVGELQNVAKATSDSLYVFDSVETASGRVADAYFLQAQAAKEAADAALIPLPNLPSFDSPIGPVPLADPLTAQGPPELTGNAADAVNSRLKEYVSLAADAADADPFAGIAEAAPRAIDTIAKRIDDLSFQVSSAFLPEDQATNQETLRGLAAEFVAAGASAQELAVGVGAAALQLEELGKAEALVSVADVLGNLQRSIGDANLSPVEAQAKADLEEFESLLRRSGLSADEAAESLGEYLRLTEELAVATSSVEPVQIPAPDVSNVLRLADELDFAISQALSTDQDARKAFALRQVALAMSEAGASADETSAALAVFDQRLDVLDKLTRIREVSREFATEFGRGIRDIVTGVDDLESGIRNIAAAVSEVALDRFLIDPLVDGASGLFSGIGESVSGLDGSGDTQEGETGQALADALGGIGDPLDSSGVLLTSAAQALIQAAAALAAAATAEGAGGLAGSLGGLAGSFIGPPEAPGGGGFIGPPAPSAFGNAFSGGRVHSFANGSGFGGGGLRGNFGDAFTEPTLFPLGMAGEAGEEAIMPGSRSGGAFNVGAMLGGKRIDLPLTRDSSGALAVDLGSGRPTRFEQGGAFGPGGSTLTGFGARRGRESGPGGAEGRGDTFAFTYNISTPNADSFRRSKRQEEQDARRLIGDRNPRRR